MKIGNGILMGFPTYFSRCSKHIRSLATFSFFAMIFFKLSTVIWLSTTTEKLPPVVVVILRVICDTTEDEPHPSVKSRESLPDGNFSIFFCSSIFSTQHPKKNVSIREINRTKNLTPMHKRNDERVLFFCKWFAVCHTNGRTAAPRQNRIFISDFSIELYTQYHRSSH